MNRFKSPFKRPGASAQLHVPDPPPPLDWDPWDFGAHFHDLDVIDGIHPSRCDVSLTDAYSSCYMPVPSLREYRFEKNEKKWIWISTLGILLSFLLIGLGVSAVLDQYPRLVEKGQISPFSEVFKM